MYRIGFFTAFSEISRRREVGRCPYKNKTGRIRVRTPSHASRGSAHQFSASCDFSNRVLFRLAACLLPGLLGFSAAAVAEPVSFPILLDPTVPNAWIVASNIHAPYVDTGDEETYLTGITTSKVGLLSGPLIVAGGANAGAFSDLTHGAMGVGVAGNSDGSGEVVVDYLVVNVDFSGTGQSTVNFHVTGSAAADGCVGIDCQAGFTAYMSVYAPGAVQENTPFAGHCVGGIGCTGIPFPQDLSLPFSTDSSVHQFQFQFFLGASANGFAGVQALDTALISFDLAPGVTMDTGSGFLTQPGEPNFGGGGPSVPEPSTTSLLGVAGLIALGARRRKKNF